MHIDADRDLIRAAKIDPDGALEFVDIAPNVDEIATVAQVAPGEVTPRATWTMNGSGPVTAWAPKTGERKNQLAARILGDLLPQPVTGVPEDQRLDRTRARLAEDPLAGVVVLVGYDRQRQAPSSLPDVAAERVRALVDGRQKARRNASKNTAPTTSLPQQPPTTEIPAQDGGHA